MKLWAVPLHLLKWRTIVASASALAPSLRASSFRSDAALEAIAKASQHKIQTLLLYNYPSFSGAFSALIAPLFHSRLNLPCLILPFSSVEPLRVEDLCTEGLERLYLLDFLGPKGFAEELSRRASCKVIGFDHRKSALPNVPSEEDCSVNFTFHLNVEKSSSVAVYEYFSAKLLEIKDCDGMDLSLLESKDRDRVEMVLKYIEDVDLRRWSLPDIKGFNIGLDEWRSKLNCLTNPYMHEQGVRADRISDVIDDIGKELSLRSAAAGLRPIGAVIYMQRNNLKMCLRSTDIRTDTSEVAKAYGGGGSLGSSSFIIRMDEYNQWLSANH